MCYHATTHLQVVMGSNVDNVSTNSNVEVVFTICSYIVGVVFYTILVGTRQGRPRANCPRTCHSACRRTLHAGSAGNEGP